MDTYNIDFNDINEVLKLLRGDYYIPIHRWDEVYTVPTNISVVLEKYVYKNVKNKEIFQEALYTLLKGSVADAFTAFSYIDFIIVYFDKNNVSSFKINIDETLRLVKEALHIHREEFMKPIRFPNGKVNDNPMWFIEFFSNRVFRECGIDLLG